MIQIRYLIRDGDWERERGPGSDEEEAYTCRIVVQLKTGLVINKTESKNRPAARPGRF